MPAPETIGLIGAGLLGSALAERLSAAGFHVLAWDRDDARVKMLARLGVEPAVGAAMIGGRCTRIVLTYNCGRFGTAVGVLLAGALFTALGGDYPRVGTTCAMIYALGIVAIWFAPLCPSNRARRIGHHFPYCSSLTPMTISAQPLVAALLALGWGVATVAAEPAPGPKTLMTDRGALLLKDDFSEAPGPEWKVSAPTWEPADGALKATHTKPFPSNHGPVLQRQLAMKNVVVQVEVQLASNTRAVLHFNKANGHLCRALITPEAFYIIRRDSGGDQGTRLDTDESPIAPDVWHVLLVELAGNEMVASLDGRKVLIGKRDDLDQAKTALILEASSGTAWFKNLRVWQATPKADWEATRTKLQTGGKAPEQAK